MAKKDVWKKWEKDMAKWVIQYLSPWQQLNPGKSWVDQLHDQGEVTTLDEGGLHPPPPPPIP